MKVIKLKPKRLLSLLLVVCTISSLCFPSSYIVKATSYISTSQFTYKDNSWSAVANTYTSTSPSLTLSAIQSNDGNVYFPSFADFKAGVNGTALANGGSYDGTLALSQNSKEVFNKAKRIFIGNDYETIPANYLSENTSIEEITIDTENDITLSTRCFSSMSALKNVTIKAKSITIQGSVFRNCENLENITLTGSVTFTGGSGSGYNFSNCPKLNMVKFNNDVTFKDANNFTSTTFSTASSANVTFNGAITNANTVFSACNLKDLNLNGSGNTLTNSFLENTTITNLNVNAATTFGKKALYYSENTRVITNFNINGALNEALTTTFEQYAIYSFSRDYSVITNFTINNKCTFGNYALYHVGIENLYFNIDNRGDREFVSYEKEGDRLGYETTVHNIFFNYQNTSGATGQTMELNHFPLGDDSTTSLNCDSIYFLHPDFKYIGGSDYNRCDGEKTNVYGYGGALAYDDDGNLLSAYEMYQSWMKNKSCNYHNYVSNADTLDYEIKNTIIYLGEDEKTVSYDFASDANISVYATYEKDAINPPVTDGSKFKLSIITGSKVSTNYNYRILEKNDSVTASTKELYAYKYNGSYYTPCTTSTVSLTAGTHEFLLEVGGVKHPFKIRVQKNAVQEITSIQPKTGDKLNLTLGDEVTKDMLIVTAKFDNGKTEILTDDQYEIDNPKVVSAETTIRISSKVSEDKTVTKSFIAYGYPDQIVSFNATATKATLPEDSILHTSDVVLSSVTYANPNTPVVEQVTEGFSFVVNDQETQEVPIKLGDNKITIRYNGCTMNDILTITGTENTITKVEATYTGNGVYENCAINPEDVTITIYKENSSAGIVITDHENITFDQYQIIANQDNAVPVFYKGIAAEAPITVPGLKDDVSELKTIQYNGDTTIGTIFNASDFYIEVSLLSQKVLNSNDNPELLNALTFSKSTLTDSLNVITVIYNDTFVKSITICGTGAKTDDPVTVPPSTTPSVTTPPTATPTSTPIIVVSPDVPNDNVTNAPTTPTVPTATPVNKPTNTPTPAAKKLTKGKSYTVNNVVYKVISVSKKTAKVCIVGHKKAAKSISVKSSVKINGYTCKVVSIQKNAFKNCSALKGSISLAGNISYVADNAFSGCKNITSVTIGKNLTTIGSKCFYNCKKLKLVNLKSAKKLKRVGSGAFKQNASKRQFRIPSGTKNYYVKLLKGKY